MAVACFSLPHDPSYSPSPAARWIIASHGPRLIGGGEAVIFPEDRNLMMYPLKLWESYSDLKHRPIQCAFRSLYSENIHPRSLAASELHDLQTNHRRMEAGMRLSFPDVLGGCRGQASEK